VPLRYTAPCRERGGWRRGGIGLTVRCDHSSRSAFAPPGRSLQAEITLRAGSPTANASARRTVRLNPFSRESSAAPLKLPGEFVCALCNGSEAGTFRLLPLALTY